MDKTKHTIWHRTIPVLAFQVQHLKKPHGPRQSGTIAYPINKAPHIDGYSYVILFICSGDKSYLAMEY